MPGGHPIPRLLLPSFASPFLSVFISVSSWLLFGPQGGAGRRREAQGGAGRRREAQWAQWAEWEEAGGIGAVR